MPETSEFVAPDKQPENRFVHIGGTFSAAQDGMYPVPIDQTRQLVSMLARTPDIIERIHQGGIVGYLTIAVGVTGLLITLYRSVYLLVSRSVSDRQMQQADVPDAGNPLGRIMLSVETGCGRR